GNGFSATIAAEMRRTVSAGIFNQNSAVFGLYGGFQSPDIVGNLRVDQAWGSAQIMAAAHQVNPVYYDGAESTGHPDDKWGFAVGAGIKLNAPMIGQGDFFQAQVNYTQGALRYIFSATQGNWLYREGDTAGVGAVLDGAYGGLLALGTASEVELTTAWNVNAAYEHFWNPRWRTSVYGGYAEVSYNGAANAMMCSNSLHGIGIDDGAGNGTAAVASPGCNQDWSTWWVGTRTQWNVTKDFYMGLDVLYNRLNTATSSSGLLNSGFSTGPFTGGPSNPIRVDDQDNFQFRFRVHRDFYP
ncbi:MAG: porin, partial [Pseudolabrys sp.]